MNHTTVMTGHLNPLHRFNQLSPMWLNPDFVIHSITFTTYFDEEERTTLIIESFTITGLIHELNRFELQRGSLNQALIEYRNFRNRINSQDEYDDPDGI